MAVYDPSIRPLLPEFINGKSHKQFMDRVQASDKENRHHYIDNKKFPTFVQEKNFEAISRFEVRDAPL